VIGGRQLGLAGMGHLGVLLCSLLVEVAPKTARPSA